MAGGHDPRDPIERRLEQPRWLVVVVPVGSLPSPSSCRGDRARGDRPRRALAATARSSTRRSWPKGALRQTLIAATPLAFTGLAAAAAFRMRLFNIGGEGQLYVGAITAAAAGLYLGGTRLPSPVVIARDGRRRRGRRRGVGR